MQAERWLGFGTDRLYTDCRGGEGRLKAASSGALSKCCMNI